MKRAPEIPGEPDAEQLSDSMDEEATMGVAAPMVGICWSLSSALLAASVITVASLIAPQVCVHDSFALRRLTDGSESLDMW